MTGLSRVRRCGWTTVTGQGGPTLRVSEVEEGKVAGYAGLATCGSVWACPVCAAKVAAGRAGELAHVMGKVLESGGSAAMITLTMAHHRGDRLADCWEAAAKAWANVTSGKRWVADQDQFGMLGWAKVTEVTCGDNGWHVHLHVLICFDRPVSLETAEAVAGQMWWRWACALRKRGFQSRALLEGGAGLDVRMADLHTDGLADYFQKIAHEVTGSQVKRGRGGSRTPFQILESAVDGVADDIELWWEWEKASFDRRQLTWSQGSRDLRRWAGLTREQTDEELAQHELGGDDVLALPADTWEQVRGTRMAVELLEVAEIGGQQAARAWLQRRGLAADVVRSQRL